MANVGEEVPVTKIINNMKAVDRLWIPQFSPEKIVKWFIVLEAQFECERIMNDELRFNIVIANLQKEYLKHVEDIVLNPPATGRYLLLRDELIKRLVDSNNQIVQGSNINKDNVELIHRVIPSHPSHLTPQVDDPKEIANNMRKWKLFEREQMGNRTPSQFYRALKDLSIPSTPEDLILTVWKVRLPMYMQKILAARTETDANILTNIADRIYEMSIEEVPAATARKSRN